MAFKDKAQADSSFPGIAIVKPGCGKQLYQPTKVSETVIRPYPVPDGSGGFLSYRCSSDRDDFSDWIEAEPVARFVGSEQRVTFIARCKDQHPSTNELLWDRLCRIVIKAIDSGEHPEWVYLIRRGGGNAGPAIPGQTVRQAKAKTHAFIQGVLLKHRGNSFRQQPKANVVLMLPPTAKIGLLRLCNEEVPNWSGPDPEDYSSRFTCGEFLDPKTGRELIFTLNNNNSNDDSGGAIDFNNASGNSASKMGGQPGRMVMNAYEVTIGEQPTPIPPKLINQFYQPWDKVLRYLNEQEQVELMCTAFKPDVVKAAFGNMGLLPASLEKGKTVNLPSEPGPVVTPPIAEEPEPEFAVHSDINFGNVDDGSQSEESESEPNISDPTESDEVANKMAEALAKAREAMGQ